MKVLVLTDHSGHTASNSLYALTRALVAAPQVTEVRVASRTTPANRAFFAADPTAATSSLSTLRADADFAYETSFRENEYADTELTWPELVLLRVPHPIPNTWFEWLDARFSDSVILNEPGGIAATTSKAWLLNVPELCPRMAHCRTPAEVLAFAKTGDAVLKPLRGYGGKDIWRVRAGVFERGDDRVPLAAWTEHPDSRQEFLAMEFLTRVGEGDKRIVVVDGEVLGAVLRVPAPGSWLCNVAQGGHVEPSRLSAAEEEIVAALSPRMRDLGVAMYGVDTLVGNGGHRVLSEVNTMSIGGLLDLPAGPRGRTAPQRAAVGLLAVAEQLLLARTFQPHNGSTQSAV